MSDRDALRRLGILALVASCGAIGASLPNIIAGVKMLAPEQVMDAIEILRRKGLIIRSTRKHPDGDRRFVHYSAAEDLELSVGC